jgi:hypothetical protein
MTSPPPDDPPIDYPGYQPPPPAPVPAPYSPPMPYPQPLVVYVQPAPLPPTTSPSATASLVLSTLGLFTMCCSFGALSLMGIILGHVALFETKNDARPGRGMAIAGLIMGYIGVVPALIFSIQLVTGGLDSTPS